MVKFNTISPRRSMEEQSRPVFRRKGNFGPVAQWKSKPVLRVRLKVQLLSGPPKLP